MNRVLLTVVVLLLAAALAAFLRARGDRHELGGAIDLAGSIEPVITEFNRWVDHPRLVMILSPACPVCLQGAKVVQDRVLVTRGDLRVLTIWMEALPFDITRNPGRRVESFAGEERMVHFYDTQQVAGEVFKEVLEWAVEGPPWDVYLFYPEGVTWGPEAPVPTDWVHQREVADPARYRTGEALTRALIEAAMAL